MITPQHIIGPGDGEIDELAKSLYEGKTKKIFGLISHTLLKAEQKSEPWGFYRSKEIIWEVNVDRILINEWIEEKQPPEISQVPIGCFHYRSVNGTNSDCNVVLVERTYGDFDEALNYYKGVTRAADPPVLDTVFKKDDDGITPGYFNFQTYLDGHLFEELEFKFMDIIASEEAIIRDCYYDSEEDFTDKIENKTKNLKIDDHRQKRIEMYSSLRIDATDKDDFPRYRFIVVYIANGEVIMMDRADTLRKALGLYNEINIREGKKG